MAKFLGRDLTLQVKISGVWTTIPTVSDSGTVNNDLVDVTTKDEAPWRELLANCGIRSGSIVDTGFITDAVSFNYLHAQFQSGAFIEARLTDPNPLYVAVAYGIYQIAAFERAGEYNNAEQFNMALESSGALADVLQYFMIVSENVSFDPVVGTQGSEVFRWEFGDGSPDQIDNSPNHTYTGTPPYEVRLYDESVDIMTTISAANDGISELNVQGFDILSSIIINSNNLATLDVSSLPLLERLLCYTNDLTSIDVSDCPLLDELKCQTNNLTSLDVSENLNLLILQCNSNDLAGELPVGNLTLLEDLRCYSNNTISVLNVSNLTALTNLQCYTNAISILDVTNLVNLTKLECDFNNISVLNVTNLVNLTRLECDDNNLTTLDTSNLAALTYIECDNNSLSGTLDLSATSALTYVDCANNSLDTLTFIPCPSLTDILATSNDITAVNLTGMVSLDRISFANNALTSLDITDLVSLVDLLCNGNDIATFTAGPSHPVLDDVRLQGNYALASIDLSNMPALARLELDENVLTTINISNNPLLTRLEIDNNNLETSSLNNALLNLDAFGLSSGLLAYENNNSNPDYNSYQAYESLIGKSWTITGAHPTGIISTENETPDSFSGTVAVSAGTPRWYMGDGTEIVGLTANHTYSDEPNEIFIGDLLLTAITSLTINDDDVTGLDISGLTNLTTLSCDDNLLTALNIFGLGYLNNLSCKNNQITTLNLLTINALSTIDCSNNSIAVLAIDSHPAISSVNCESNLLTALTVNGLNSLDYLICHNNYITPAEIDDILIDLDNAGNSNGTLEYYANAGIPSSAATAAYNALVGKGWTIKGAAPECLIETTSATPDSFIGSMAVSIGSPSWTMGDGTTILGLNANHTYIDGEPAHGVDIINVAKTNITQLDIAGDITAVNLTQLVNLQDFRCHDENLKALDLSANTVLLYIDVENNNLDELDLSSQVNLQTLRAFSNNLTSIDLTGLVNLEDCNLFNNDLTTISLPSSLVSLKFLNVSSNPMTAIDITDLPAIEEININNCSNFGTFDVSGITTLTEIRCFSCDTITVLEVSLLTNLIHIDCETNQISVLDTTNLVNMVELDCEDNFLTVLDVSGMTVLEILDFSSNSISTIDISNSPLLDDFACSNNSLPDTEIDAIIIQLDTNGLSNGTLEYDGNADPTGASYTAYSNLISKGWTITGNAPPSTGFITTTSATPDNFYGVLTVAGTPRWIMGDGDEEIGAAINHVYIDAQPTHVVNILDITKSAATILQVYFDDITALDLSEFTSLKQLRCYNNTLTALDLSANTLLEDLRCNDNTGISTLDISMLTSLDYIRCDDLNITVLDVSNSPLLKTVMCHNCQLPSGEIDDIIINLDGFGLSSGTLNYGNNAGNPSAASLTAYNNLVGKGWTITGAVPA